MQLGWPYPATAASPVWGPQTSFDNFCEEDYLLTGWIAEFVNTLTNSIYVIYAWHGYSRSAAGPSGDGTRLAYLGLGVVGVWSGAYHATLKLAPNFGDSLSMLVAVAVVLYRVYTFDRDPAYRRRFAAWLVASQLVVSAIFIATRITYVHNASFAVMVFRVARRARALLQTHVAEEALRTRLRYAARLGSIAAVVGYLLWNIDFAACSQLHSARKAVGMPLGFLLELHGWWHILTGVGAYIYLSIVDIILAQKDGQVSGRVVASNYAWPMSRLLASPGA